MPYPNRGVVCVGILLMTVGFALLVVGQYTLLLALIGLILAIPGLLILIYAFCMAMKSSHEAVPGHYLLHPPTGTRYSHQQAIAVQRRLDRIRRAVEDENRVAQRPPPVDPNLNSVPGTPPPWQMEPPPSYETVMKTSPGITEHL